MKNLNNDPRSVVPEMLEGLVGIHPGLRLLDGHAVIVRADGPSALDGRVALISGGGSGHEPAHAGYVGRGMLAAAVAGDVFTSPSPEAILAAIRAVGSPAGVLLLVKNYTGDRLNFGLAAEIARVEGLPVAVVIVADDVALSDSAGHAGRRGLAGTILVHKIAGAAAEARATLVEVAAEARAAAVAVKTMGVALSPCTVPAAGRPGFLLADDEIEIGLGIHGEPGVRRGRIEPADALVAGLLGPILAEVPRGPVALLVNNLGGSTTMEVAIVARAALAILDRGGYAVERVYAGTFLSALEMAGVSLSVLPVDEARLARLDAPTDAPAWPNVHRSRTRPAAVPAPSVHRVPPTYGPPQTALGQTLEAAIRSAVTSLIAAEARLTELDQQAGDGDLGISLRRGAEAVLAALATFPRDEPSRALHALGSILQSSLGGSSGPLYAVFCLRASARLGAGNTADWVAALRAGCEGIADLGGAAEGDRTMLDALLPAARSASQALEAGRSALDIARSAAVAAAVGAEATAAMAPRRGRSSYLGDRVLGLPDPGAVAAAIWLEAVAEALTRHDS